MQMQGLVIIYGFVTEIDRGWFFLYQAYWEVFYCTGILIVSFNTKTAELDLEVGNLKATLQRAIFSLHKSLDLVSLKINTCKKLIEFTRKVTK